MIAGGYPPPPALSDSPGTPVFPHFFPLVFPLYDLAPHHLNAVLYYLDIWNWLCHYWQVLL